MAVIRLETPIAAPVERVFDLARSIDAHQETAGRTRERVVAGVTQGLLELGQEVTWEARHLGITQRLSVKMTQLERPIHFQDVMVKGAFKQMRHDHDFEVHEDRTVMIDRFEFCSPFGIIGTWVDQCLLERYMRRFLKKRNAGLKWLAESSGWRKYLLPANETGLK